MESLFVKATDKTPEINFNAKTGHLSFIGRSYSSDTYDFYKPVNEWINKYALHPRENTVLEINVDYFNSVSVKYLTNIIRILGELASNKRTVVVKWLYAEEDDDDNDALDLGKSIERESPIKFVYVVTE